MKLSSIIFLLLIFIQVKGQDLTLDLLIKFSKENVNSLTDINNICSCYKSIKAEKKSLYKIGNKKVMKKIVSYDSLSNEVRIEMPAKNRNNSRQFLKVINLPNDSFQTFMLTSYQRYIPNLCKINAPPPLHIYNSIMFKSNNSYSVGIIFKSGFTTHLEVDFEISYFILFDDKFNPIYIVYNNTGGNLIVFNLSNNTFFEFTLSFETIKKESIQSLLNILKLNKSRSTFLENDGFYKHKNIEDWYPPNYFDIKPSKGIGM